MANTKTSDVTVQNHGSIFLFITNTDAAREWVEENVQLEDYMSMGLFGFKCEARYAADIVAGMQDYGLQVE